MEANAHLADLLTVAHSYERQGDYKHRNEAILRAAGYALDCHYDAGVKFHNAEGERWPVLFIELPTGQVSWHLLSWAGDWDGHTTEEKWERVKRFARAAAPDLTYIWEQEEARRQQASIPSQ